MRNLQDKLFAAAQDGDQAKLEGLLLHPKCDALAKNDDGWTALMWAARCGNASCLQRLLQVSDPWATDHDGSTALIHASFGGHTSCLQLLLPVSDPWAKTHNGWTALMHASCGGHTSCLQLLLPVSELLVRDTWDRHASDIAMSMGYESLARLIDAYGVAQGEEIALSVLVPAGAPQKRNSRRV